MPDRPCCLPHFGAYLLRQLEGAGTHRRQPGRAFRRRELFLGKDGLPNGTLRKMAFKAMGELMPALDQEPKALVRECVAEYNAQGFTSARLGGGHRQPERRNRVPHL